MLTIDISSISICDKTQTVPSSYFMQNDKRKHFKNIKSVFSIILLLKMKQLLRFLFAFMHISNCSTNYENFKVYSILCETQSDVEKIKLWQHNNPMVDFWSAPGVNKSADIFIDPPLQTKLEEFLSFEAINYEILIENVGKLVESSTFRSRISIKNPSNIFSFFLSLSIQFRTIKNHRRNKLKFHFPSGNFTDTVRDFSHYWTLLEVNLVNHF